MPRCPRRRFGLSALVLCLAAAGSPTLAQLPAGYHDDDAFRARAEQLAESDHVSLTSLATTAGGRDVLLLTVAKSEASRPAILVVGSVDGASLVGSHLALDLVETLGRDDQLLEDVTFYVIPRPSPDAAARRFASPLTGAAVNTRPMDDDRDGEVDEDPPEDLNGDGLITMMRIADEAGAYRALEADPRVLVKADPTKGERGAYRLLTEGVDNDGDEKWNEDAPGGVDFNRNFTFRYPYFKPDAGPHQVSEPETRAVADFAYDHPNIFLVFSIASEDNLNHPWKTKPGDGRIKRSVQGDDAKYLQRIAKRYQELTKAKDAPPAAAGEGAFVPWAYFHYGRWSIATRGWWPTLPEPEAEEKPAESGDEAGEDAEAPKKPAAKPKKPAKPTGTGAADLVALKWMESAGVDGFVDWTEVEHPDFPGKTVEVGGFKPAARAHPPIDHLDAGPLVELLQAVAADRAQIGILSAHAQPLGEGLVRVTAAVINRGSLPTSSAMGSTSRQLQRLMVTLHGPDAMQVLSGPQRQDLGVLAPGGVAEREWLVRLPAGAGIDSLHVWAGEPSVGFAESDVENLEKGASQQ